MTQLPDVTQVAQHDGIIPAAAFVIVDDAWAGFPGVSFDLTSDHNFAHLWGLTVSTAKESVQYISCRACANEPTVQFETLQLILPCRESIEAMADVFEWAAGVMRELLEKEDAS